MLAGVLLVAAGCMSFTEGFAAVNDSRASSVTPDGAALAARCLPDPTSPLAGRWVLVIVNLDGNANVRAHACSAETATARRRHGRPLMG